MQLFLKRLKGDPVLLAAWGLALVSAFLVPPDREWLGYVDFHTLGLLFCLMLVMAGLQDIGFFQRLGEGILGRTRTARQLELVLVLLCFFTAMLITNAVALITFVPFAGAVLGMAGLTDRIVPVVVFQTVAANLGSMATPVGNPQNLYLYSHYGVPLGEFFGAVLPFAGLSLVLLTGALLMRRSAPLPEIPSTAGQLPPARGRLLCYLGLFLLSLAAVAKLIPVLLLVMRFGEFRPGKPIGRWGQVFATFAIGAAIYIGLLLGYNPLCDAWVWAIIIILLFAFVVKILGLESMLHPHKGCLASYVIILLYSSYLIALVGLSVVLHPLSVHQIRVVGEAEGYQYIGWVDSNRDICPLGTYLFTDVHGDTYYYYDVISGKIADHRNIGQLLNSINVEKG